MKKFVLFLVFLSVNIFAERRIVENVGYIQQILDTDHKDENGKRMFYGYNACGPTSATMLVQFHNLQLVSQKGRGWYIFNPYIGFTDKAGNNYSTDFARDWDGVSQVNSYNKHHPNEVLGAHGYIVENSARHDLANPYWAANLNLLVSYLRNHGLKTELHTRIDLGLYERIRVNINAGLPLICSFSGTHPTYGSVGHYLVVVGYDDDDGNKLILHDPNGDINDDWSGSNATAGIFVEYDYPNIQNSISFNRFIEVHPIGVYSWFPGWRQGSLSPKSQPFLDCYNNEEKHGGPGREVFGIPWNNGPGGPWVHPWPDGVSDMNTVYVQDFINYDHYFSGEEGHWWQLVLNQKENKVYPLHGHILAHWNSNSGYLNYGEPKSYEYNMREKSSGDLLVIQEFEKNGLLRYLGYNTVSGSSGKYSFFEMLPFGGGNSSDDPAYIVDPILQVAGYTHEPEMSYVPKDTIENNSDPPDQESGIKTTSDLPGVDWGDPKPGMSFLFSGPIIYSRKEQKQYNESGVVLHAGDTADYFLKISGMSADAQIRFEAKFNDSLISDESRTLTIPRSKGEALIYVFLPEMVEGRYTFKFSAYNGNAFKALSNSFRSIDVESEWFFGPVASIRVPGVIPLRKPAAESELYDLFGRKLSSGQRADLSKGVFVIRAKNFKRKVLNVQR